MNKNALNQANTDIFHVCSQQNAILRFEDRRMAFLSADAAQDISGVFHVVLAGDGIGFKNQQFLSGNGPIRKVQVCLP